MPLKCGEPARHRQSSKLILVLLLACLSKRPSFAQYPSIEHSDSIRGTVINSVTREPIGRALVSSPDNRLATLTDSDGRFEFTLPKTETNLERDPNSGLPLRGRVQIIDSVRPDMLMARKPGFLTDQNNPFQNLQNVTGKEVTIPLIPEALIVGTVTLPTAEAPDSIFLQIYRRQVQEGRAHWVPGGGTQSKSDGQFRFADLPAGTYKLLTRELLDRDPLTSDPRGQQFGYPPAYSQNAPDFATAGSIHVSAGETGQANLTLAKQPYYRVKVGVTNVTPEVGINVSVYALGRKGPGFALGYNNRDQAIEGMLPNGIYTIEASTFGPNSTAGLLTLTVKGAAVEGPRMTMAPVGSIDVNVTEQFTSDDHTGSSTITTNGRSVTLNGPRRYLNLWLESDDDFERGGRAGLRNPTKPGDESLVIENVRPGRYWVRVNSSRGFAASIRSGSTDLLRQPLVISADASTSPIEITMRDDSAEISGTVDGIAAPPREPATATDGGGGLISSPTYVDPAAAHIYCIPLPDSSGQFTEIWVSPDGSFTSPPLPPGAYRLLAFDRPQPELEYRNPDAMQAYGTKGPVVRVASGQKENVRLPLISTSE
jgi:hypothetical protein